jgi:hypothetical protein
MFLIIIFLKKLYTYNWIQIFKPVVYNKIKTHLEKFIIFLFGLLNYFFKIKNLINGSKKHDFILVKICIVYKTMI